MLHVIADLLGVLVAGVCFVAFFHVAAHYTEIFKKKTMALIYSPAYLAVVVGTALQLYNADIGNSVIHWSWAYSAVWMIITTWLGTRRLLKLPFKKPKGKNN